MAVYTEEQKILARVSRNSNTAAQVIERTGMLADLGLQNPHTSGHRQIRALCPFHNEKIPSFYVSIDTGDYMCHSCLAKGKFDTLIAHLCKTSASDIRSAFSGIKDSRPKKPLVKDEEYFRSLLYKIKVENPEHGFTIHNKRCDNDIIVASRASKISANGISEFGLKVVDVEFKFEKTQGILIPLNICPTHEDDIANGLMQIRVLGEHFKKQKYLNMINTSNMLFDYKRCMKQKGMPLVVCEGVFDHIRLVDVLGCSVRSTCSFGARMSDQQIALCCLVADTIIIAYDNDDEKFESGKSPAESFLRYLESIKFSELNPKKKIIRYKPECHDFGSAEESDLYRFLEFYKTC